MPGFGPGLGFGYGFSTLIWTVAIIVVSVVIWRERRGYVSGTPIVLKRFHLNEDPAAGTVVEIVGRTSGILSWILNLLRLEQDFRFIVTDSEASVIRGSLSGIVHTYIPLNKVTSTVCGYQRSILAFALAALFTVGFVLNLLSGLFENNRNEIGSDMGLAFGFLILAAIFALVYFLSKRIGINIETMHRHGLVFKRSVIENVEVDLPQALRAISVINTRVLAAQTLRSLPGELASPAAPSRKVSMPPLVSEPGRCPKCSTVNPIGTRFCENCGSALPG
jgi:hypothetical protein